MAVLTRYYGAIQGNTRNDKDAKPQGIPKSAVAEYRMQRGISNKEGRTAAPPVRSAVRLNSEPDSRVLYWLKASVMDCFFVSVLGLFCQAMMSIFSCGSRKTEAKKAKDCW
jgi:hypothetical protein